MYLNINGQNRLDEAERVSITLEADAELFNELTTANSCEFALKVKHFTGIDWIGINIGDSISTPFFTGKVDNVKVVKKNLYTEYSVTAKDEIKKIIDKTVENDMRIYNETSLISTIAGWAAGIEINESVFNSAGLKYIEIEKGTKAKDILNEIFEAFEVRMFTNKSNNIVFLKEYETGGGVSLYGSVLKKAINKNTKKRKYDGVVVKYKNYTRGESKTVFNISNSFRIAENSESKVMNFQYNEIVDYYYSKIEELKIEKADGTILFHETKDGILIQDANIVREIIITGSQTGTKGGTIKITNNNPFEIFLTSLKIESKPVIITENTLTYAEAETSSNLFKIESKWIQGTENALKAAEVKYKKYCADSTEYEVTTDPENVQSLDVGVNLTISNPAINQDSESFKVKAIEYSFSKEENICTIRGIRYENPIEVSYIKIEESLAGSETSSIDSSLEEQLRYGTVLYAEDTSDEENVYKIALDEKVYKTHDNRHLIKFLSKNANTGPAVLKINQLTPYAIKKQGWTKDLDAGDIIKDMIVVVNYNSRKNVFEAINQVGIANIAAGGEYTYTAPYGIEVFCEVKESAWGNTWVDGEGNTVDHLKIESGEEYHNGDFVNWKDIFDRYDYYGNYIDFRTYIQYDSQVKITFNNPSNLLVQPAVINNYTKTFAAYLGEPTTGNEVITTRNVIDNFVADLSVDVTAGIMWKDFGRLIYDTVIFPNW